jgi:tight adherence protein C
VTAAALLAGLAGICATVAIADLLALRRAAARVRGAAPPRGGHLGAMTILLARIARRAGMRPPSDRLREKIAAAGSPLGLAPADVMALKVVAAVVGALLAFMFLGVLPGRLGFAALLSMPAAGFLAPDVLLARRGRARATSMRHELADVLDLLRVGLQAGLPVGRALAEVGRRCHGLLAGELDTVAIRLRLGEPRDQTLAGLVARCPIGGVARLVDAIARADRHGAPLAPALEAIVAEARAEQARLLRDEAAKAAPKIQLVVALVLVPAVMLLLAAVLVQALG